jgi:DnaK suppressor protein
MGFSTAAPVHSRAEEKAPVGAPELQAVAATSASSAQAHEKTARRPPVKAPAVKQKAVPAKTVAAVQPAPAAKVTSVAAARKAVVPSEAASPQPASKPVAKAKSAAKPAVTKAPATKAAVKKVEPVKKGASAKAAPATPPIPAPTSKKPQSVTTLDPTEKVTSTPKFTRAPKPTDAVAAAKPAPTAQLTPLGVPVRSGRPSSRLAQLTVPSMAQSVASTAAKASFTQMTTVQPIVSPLASAIKKDPKLANNWKKKAVAELTDEEIIAMSDDDYMNETQMAFFRLKLVSLKNDILSNAGETTEHLREDTVVVPDPADRATIEEEHALELRTRDRERKLLKKIEQSINRIDAGDYGYCDETGEPIGVGRLLARPTATLSLEAQQRRELKQKMFGD